MLLATPEVVVGSNARHYQALMDATFLQRGGKVEALPSSVVIFVCDFDPFGKDLRLYDCRTTCIQTRDVVPDRRCSVYLSATATGGEVSDDLDAFLRYVRGEDVRGNAFVDGVREVVHSCLEDESWMEAYMTLEEYYENEVKQRVKVGVKKGVEEAVGKAAKQTKLDTFSALVRDGLLDVGVAAERAGVSAEEMTKLAAEVR
ncbi:MAG: hypothetical protein IKG21_03900 [Atopobiaceae bacterium]|nr:hypothetical protein [Atopobiaceae bacterium]